MLAVKFSFHDTFIILLPFPFFKILNSNYTILSLLFFPFFNSEHSILQEVRGPGHKVRWSL